MRNATWTALCLFSVLLLPACGKKGDRSGSTNKTTEPTPEELKAKKAAAIKAAKSAAIAAFEKTKVKFRWCDHMRRGAIVYMRSSTKWKQKAALKNLKKSRVCLASWWNGIDALLKPKKIGRDQWMPHAKPWAKEVMKVVVPAPKPFSGGTKYVLKGSRKKTTVTVSAPAEWKREKEKDKKKAKQHLKLLAGNVDYEVTIRADDKVEPRTETVKRAFRSTVTRHAQLHEVQGVKGALDVMYVVDQKWTQLVWTGELDVDPKKRSGDIIQIRMNFRKSDWPTKKLIGQFVNLLEATKFKIAPRKK